MARFLFKIWKIEIKLLRFGDPGKERPGSLDADSKIKDLSDVVDDIAGVVLLDSELEKLRGLDLAGLPEVPS